MNVFNLIAAVAAFVLVPTFAAADPITSAIFTWLASAGVPVLTATFIATAFVRLATSFVLSALSAALSGKNAAATPGIKTEATTTGGTNPQSFILGRYATEGNLVCPPYSTPNDGAVPNEFLTYVVDVADVAGVTFERLALSGVWVDDWQASAGLHATEGKIDAGLPRVQMTFYDGTQTAADPYLLSEFASHTERPWAADMVGTGVSYAVLTFKYDRELFSGPPKVRFEVLGIPLYDPRADSSVGGAGLQRWDDPATWTQTENPIVMVYNITRGITLPDGKVWGSRVAADGLPLANWFAAMNECDLEIALAAGGTEPQYRAGYEVAVDTQPAAVIEELLKSCSAQITEMGGVYKVRVGAPALPVYFFTDDDIVTDNSEMLTPYPGLDGVHNAIQASYPSPEASWEVTDAPGLFNSEWEAEDGERQLVAQVNLPAVASGTQVQRLMSAWIKDGRRFRRHSLSLPPDAALLEPLDTAAWTSARHGYTGKVFEVGELGDDPTTVVQSVAIRERDTGDFVWVPAVDEVAVVLPSVNVPVLAPRIVVGFTVAAAVVVDGAGAPRRPGLLLSWFAGYMLDARAIEFQVRPVGQVALVSQGGVTDVAAGQVLVSDGILSNINYEARARLVSPRKVQWSDWQAATTGDLGMVEDDISGALFAKIDADVLASLAVFKAAEVDPIAALIPPMQTGLDDVAAAIPPLQSTITLVEKRIALREVEQRGISDAVSKMGDHVLWATAKLINAENMLRDASIIVDPDTGVVRIVALDSLREDFGAQFSEVGALFDAVNAKLELSVTTAQLNGAVSAALLDPTQIPLIDDMALEITDLGIRLDGIDASLLLKAEKLVVDGLSATLTTVQSNYDALAAAITSKVEVTVFDAAETRLASAEQIIEALDGPSITQTVADTRMLTDALDLSGISTLAGLLEVYGTRKALRVDLAYAVQDLRAKVDENRQASASAETVLGASIAENEALAEVKLKVLASVDAALALEMTTLQADIASAAGQIIELNKVDLTSGSALVQRLLQLDAEVQDPATGLAVATGAINQLNQIDLGSTSANVQALLAAIGRVGVNEGAVEQLNTVNVGSTSANVQALLSVVARVISAEGKITNLNTVDLSSGSVLVQSHLGLKGAVEDPTTGLEAARGEIDEIRTLTLAPGSALVQSFDKLEGTVGGDGLNAVPNNQLTHASLWALNGGWDLVTPSGNTGLRSKGRLRYTYAGGSGATHHAESAPFAVVGGATYAVSAQATRAGSGNFRVRIRVRWRDENEALVGSATNLVYVLETTAGIKEYAGEMVAPAEAKTATWQATPDLDQTTGTFSVAAPEVYRITESLATVRGTIAELNNIDLTSTSANVLALLALDAVVKDPATGLLAAMGAINQLNQINLTSTSANVLALLALDAVVKDPATGLAAAVGAIDQLNQIDLTSTSANVLALLALDAVVKDPASGLAAASGAIIELNNIDLTSTSANVQKLLAVESEIIDENGVALKTKVSANIGSIDGIKGVHAIQIDNNGHVSGFGLVSDLIDGQPVALFAVVADKFAIVGPGDTPEVPFEVISTPQVIDGVTVAPGTYIKKANIRAASVGSAKIKDLAVTGAKIKDLAVDTAKIKDLAVTGAKIKELTVGTLHLTDNAVTNGAVDSTPLSTSAGSPYYVEKTLSISAVGGTPLMITINANFTLQPGLGTFRLYQNGVEFANGTAPGGLGAYSNYGDFEIGRTFSVTSVAGVNNIKVALDLTGSVGWATINSIWILEIKK